MGNICIDPCLKQQTNDMKLYQLNGYYRAKVVDVYDGDTITIVLYNKGSYQKYKLRMYGYDSAELKPRLDIKNRNKIIKKAEAAKMFLSNMVLNHIVDFESFGFDKYGRLLGKIYLTKFCSRFDVNSFMVECGYGKPYFGGKKE